MAALVRYKGEWVRIAPKPYEPERQTYEIAWSLIRNVKPAEAYRTWYKTEQEKIAVLYPSFRNNKNV